MDKKDLIFQEFLFKKELKFSELEKKTKLRSNDLAYFLKQLVSKNILGKKDNKYSLTLEGEKQIPYFTRQNQLIPLPVVLVKIINKNNEVLMINREKRPYQNLWSLPGGRIFVGEQISEAAKRIVKQKTFLEINVKKNKLTTGNEFVIKEGVIQHGFVLIIVEATPKSTIKEKENIKWFKPTEIDRQKTIESDFYYASKQKPRQGKEFIIKLD